MKKITLLLIGLLLQMSAVESLQAQTKTKAREDYERISSGYDYSVNISNKNINTTYFGKLGTERMACDRNIGGKIINHTIELTDDNILLINKLDNKTLSFYLAGMSLAKRDIVKFANITQKENIVYFNILYRKSNIGKCTIRLPKGVKNFMDLFPIAFNTPEKTASVNAQFMETISLAIFFEIFDYVKGSLAPICKGCYGGSKDLGIFTIKEGMSFKSHHGELHEEGCSNGGIK
jgi:hypothetical protein